MRTIKFRGKQHKTGEWLEGDLIHYRHDVMILPLKADWFDFVPRKDNPFRLPSDKFVVDPETVGQFTGLHDKNGKEIYEGDIIRHKDMVKPYHVIYDGHQFTPNDGFRSLSYPKHWEVIGNIHDNPELINKPTND